MAENIVSTIRAIPENEQWVVAEQLDLDGDTELQLQGDGLRLVIQI